MIRKTDQFSVSRQAFEGNKRLVFDLVLWNSRGQPNRQHFDLKERSMYT